MRRKPLSKAISKKSFKKASGIHPKNRINPRRMRGGIRL